GRMSLVHVSRGVRRALVLLTVSAVSAPLSSPVGAAASPLSTRHYRAALPVAAARPTWTALALGDSVPAGSFCRCIPFPDLYAQEVSAVAHRTVTSVNFAVPGLTSDQLRWQLKDPNVAAAVANASLVSLTIGANDFDYSSSDACLSLRCYRSGLAHLATN